MKFQIGDKTHVAVGKDGSPVAGTITARHHAPEDGKSVTIYFVKYTYRGAIVGSWFREDALEERGNNDTRRLVRIVRASRGAE